MISKGGKVQKCRTYSLIPPMLETVKDAAGHMNLQRIKYLQRSHRKQLWDTEGDTSVIKQNPTRKTDQSTKHFASRVTKRDILWSCL